MNGPALAALFLIQAVAPAPVRVVFETELGAITVEVDVVRAPVTAANFLKYVEIQVIQFQSDAARSREEFPPIPLERTSVTGLRHTDGAVSMARDGPDTATSSFFIMIGDQPSLNFGGARNPDGQGFAVFGWVVGGMDVVKKIHASNTAATGDYGTETLDPVVKVLSAARK
ncbi:MAG: peptidylprolyl isomerase [Gammaproteobacteria bacterium]|nr:peptidylprolyl isomerase [Gammaproteobacteria bacterium]